MSAHDGGPAFPAVDSDIDGDTMYLGMSLRDHFAGLAMQGQIAAFADNRARAMVVENADRDGIGAKDRVARAAYEYADAMLKAREAWT